MPDDHPVNDNSQPEEPPKQPEEGEIPASVAFMEIMRQAAAKANAQRPVANPTNRPVYRSGETSPSPAAATTASPTFVDAPMRQEAMEEQRVQRVKRRAARRRRQTVGVLGGIIRSVIVIVVAAGLMATIFTWWTPSQFINDQVRNELSIVQATNESVATVVPTVIPTPNWLRRVGIVSGHRGPQVPPDPGAVCPDGLTEAEINFAVAQLVVRNLRERGYSVDLLDEFDPRLDNYQAAALVSIHANTCQNYGEVVSGFLIARAAARVGVGADDVLVNCVAQYYGQATNLQRREGVTLDMTDYHTFREINPLTPAAIIELGFMLADRPVLTGMQEEMAQGITNGIVCFLEPNQAPPSPVPATPTTQAG
ncbi:MAG: N-acetylmuramoyl-L-alanine amidase [Anaerolineae bacterium]|nr:N-acetylmuramoyl-L-alanine amidase [Anaerolineae bacterium]